MNDDPVRAARGAVRAHFKLCAEALHADGDMTVRVYPYMPSVEEVDALVVRAATDRRDWEQCRFLVEWLSRHDRPLPASLSAWAAKAISGEASPPRGPAGNATRDDLIRQAVMIARCCGVQIYSNKDEKAYTAVDIVAAALNEHGIEISGERVKALWKSRP